MYLQCGIFEAMPARGAPRRFVPRHALLASRALPVSDPRSGGRATNRRRMLLDAVELERSLTELTVMNIGRSTSELSKLERAFLD